jgi:predicted TIM-barrel fold metal-dependent hydrolase
MASNRIQGIVAYAPLEDQYHIEEALNALKAIPLVKGIRRMYDNEPSLCCSAAFLAGLQKLPACNFSFDISIKPYAMKETIRMIEKCPETRFVLDHLGKPDIENGKLDEFKKNMDILSSFPNTTAKISGLVTEANREKWTPGDVAPYIEYAIHRWGFERLVLGSDWPVVLLASSYEKWINSLMQILGGCTAKEMEKLFYANAEKIYKLV